MGLLDRFRRNRQQSVLPEEVKQYYQTENRQRRGMAVVLAVVAVVATLAIAASLFFGGRFIYNQIRGNDNGTTQPAGENGENQDQIDGTGGTGEQNPDQLPDGNGGNPAPAPAPAPNTPGQPGTPPAPAPTPTPAPGTTPPLGDNEPLPHTGDPGM